MQIFQVARDMAREIRDLEHYEARTKYAFNVESVNKYTARAEAKYQRVLDFIKQQEEEYRQEK